MVSTVDLLVTANNLWRTASKSPSSPLSGTRKNHFKTILRSENKIRKYNNMNYPQTYHNSLQASALDDSKRLLFCKLIDASCTEVLSPSVARTIFAPNALKI